MYKMGRCLLVLCVLAMPQLLVGTVYYVATDGYDSYNGLHPSYQGGSNGPFRTLSKAASVVKAGDSVQIRGGTYIEASKWSADGTQANPIIITNYNGEKVIIDGNNYTVPSVYLLQINGDWYKVSNLELCYASEGCAAAYGTHDTFYNIDAHHAMTTGINLFSTYGLIDTCRVSFTSMRYERAQGDKWSTGISIYGSIGSVDYCTIRNCVAWNNWGHGLKIGLANHATIEDCVTYNNTWNCYLRDSTNCLIQRTMSYFTTGNLIQPYVSGQYAYSIWNESIGSSNNTFINNFGMGGRFVIYIGKGAMEGMLCAHNTFMNIDDYWTSDSQTIRINEFSGYANARFQNNIIIQDDDLPIALIAATGITFGHNNWSKTPPSNGHGTGDIIANPLLAKSGSTGAGQLTPGYFKILQGSPAIGIAQVLSGVTEDFFGTPRGSNPDAGAHEYTSSSGTLTASASGSPTSGQAPLTVNFTASASGGTSPYSYSWAFGDGTSSTSQNPAHTYASSGSFTATLTVTDSKSATASKSLNVSATAAPSPLVAAASASPPSGQAPLAVSFTGSATGGTSPYTYGWTFGDGSTSTSKSPSHTYSTSGSYTATLTVTDSASVTDTSTVNINVTAGVALSANIVASPTSGQAPLAVNFTGSASGGTSPYSFSWNFGDGGSSTSQNPSHTYTSTGTYAASLTVTDSGSANASATITITVETTGTTATLSLSATTGSPSPGSGGTTDPAPGTYSFSIGSSAQSKSLPNTDYRFSKWEGDVAEASRFNTEVSVIMNTNKSLTSTFCTKCADVNGDLKITPADAQAAFDVYLKKIADPTWCELENADVNSSGTKLAPKVTPADAQMIFNKYLKKGTAEGTCSGNFRATATSTQILNKPMVKLAISNPDFDQSGDIYIPILVESPSAIGAFGLDLVFPSDLLTFVGLERTELTEGFDQVAANVFPYFGLDGNEVAQASILLDQPSDGPDRQPVELTNSSILRVGGYKAEPAAGPSSGVLITLIFRTKGKAEVSNSISIIASHDDLQNASITSGVPQLEMKRVKWPAEEPAPEKRPLGRGRDY